MERSCDSSLDTTPMKAARQGLAVVASHKLPSWAREKGRVGQPTAELDCDASWMVPMERPGGKRGWVLSPPGTLVRVPHDVPAAMNKMSK